MWCGVTCSTMGTWFSQRVMGLLIVLNKTVQMTQLKMTKICSNIFTRRHEIRNFFHFLSFSWVSGTFYTIFLWYKIIYKNLPNIKPVIFFHFRPLALWQKISMVPASEFGRFLHFFKNRVSRLHRCWWRILVTGSVGVNFEILVTDWRCWRPIT